MQKIKRTNLIITFALVFSGYSLSTLAQTPDSEWQTFGAAGEEFSVIMPKNPAAETGTMPYHKMELNTRFYLSNPANGPVYAIASFSGIKSNPALYSEMQRLNSYVDAYKKFIIPKLKGKDAVGKMTLNRSTKLNGHEGREYQLTIGELSGPVQVYVTRKRFYAIAFLSSKKDEALRDRFISSFMLPEKVVAAPETVAVQPQTQETPKATEPNKSKTTGAQPNEESGEAPAAGADAKPTEAQPSSGEKKPISGGILNKKAISLPLPIYPAEARAYNVSGTVNVQVTIDEYGNVISASAVSGHPLLQQAAVAAAYSARFSQTTLNGELVKVVGLIVYSFKP